MRDIGTFDFELRGRRTPRPVKTGGVCSDHQARLPI
jgi:hypothetical protein